MEKYTENRTVKSKEKIKNLVDFLIIKIEKMVLFVSMLVAFLALKYFLRFIIPDTP